MCGKCDNFNVSKCKSFSSILIQVLTVYHCALGAHMMITVLYIMRTVTLNQGQCQRQMSKETGRPNHLSPVSLDCLQSISISAQTQTIRNTSQKAGKPCITKWSALGIVCSNIFSVTYFVLCVCPLKCSSISAVSESSGG